ncbi:hypothetical protein VTK73DRAFT_2109 [Phialemonium thermophilum]|uniref:Myb/SANT-like domain-containing protein n=1 Tax=Phialemonium thermophilum TaxID=223376 RepID=A0ABR3X5X5_9PEZI
MGGKHWTKEEEGYYWNHIIPFSSKRVGLDKVRNKEKSWDLLAQEMTAKFGTTHRQYTSQSLAEHWFKNMQEGNYSKHAGPFVIQYLNKRAEEEEFHIENTDTKSKDSPLQEFADLDNATEEGESEISPQQSQTTVTVAQITSPGHSTDEFLHHSPLSESGVDVTLEPTLVDCPTNHSSSSNSVPGILASLFSRARPRDGTTLLLWGSITWNQIRCQIVGSTLPEPFPMASPASSEATRSMSVRTGYLTLVYHLLFTCGAILTVVVMLSRNPILSCLLCRPGTCQSQDPLHPDSCLGLKIEISSTQ